MPAQDECPSWRAPATASGNPGMRDPTTFVTISMAERSQMKLSSLVGAIGIGLLTATAAYSAAPGVAPESALAQPDPQSGGILHFAVESEPSNDDCQANVSLAFLETVGPSYSTLLKFDAQDYPRIEGDLAESWTVSPDKQTYSFRLHPGVLFHDGTPLTAADIKATYQRILHPPPGVISARQANYAEIDTIETPDPLTVIFHLQRPDAAMLAKFASPWNCIYQAAKLAADPRFPATHVLGTGPFVFAGHKNGQSWAGRRWDHYFRPGKPYLDGYEADFMDGPRMVSSLQSGAILAGFRSFTPAERDTLVATMGDRINVQESPWLMSTLLVFNTRQPPFDDARVRQALSLALDRWGMARTLSHDTVLKFVGGLLRPGFAMATPETDLATLPGFSHDIHAARTDARRLLAEAGLHDLNVTLISRDLPNAYGPRADAIIEAWRAIGVTAHEVRLSGGDWRMALTSGHYTVALDFAGDAFDDPSLQLGKYVSHALSPLNHSGASDPVLDQLYRDQAASTDEQARARIVREFEHRALTQAYEVPVLWWNRIAVTAASVKGWTVSPSPYVGQDLADVWIDRQAAGARLPQPEARKAAEADRPAGAEPPARVSAGSAPAAPLPGAGRGNG